VPHHASILTHLAIPGATERGRARKTWSESIKKDITCNPLFPTQKFNLNPYMSCMKKIRYKMVYYTHGGNFYSHTRLAAFIGIINYITSIFPLTFHEMNFHE